MMEPVALMFVVALAVLLFRRPGVFAPALAFEGLSLERADIPGDEDEQLPETDRAPRRRHALAWTVGAVALVRLVLLVALHA